MQSGGGGGGGPSRNPGVGPMGRAASSSSAASPSSSSSAVSTPHLGFDSVQQQQIASRQVRVYEISVHVMGNLVELMRDFGTSVCFRKWAVMNW